MQRRMVKAASAGKQATLERTRQIDCYATLYSTSDSLIGLVEERPPVAFQLSNSSDMQWN